MSNDEKINFLIKRAEELSRRASERNIVTHTAFLSEGEGCEILSQARLGKYIVSGGHKDAERSCIFFLPPYMEEEDLAEELDLYISVVKAEPVNKKFSETLTHRDCLGALMNLGIERNRTGDILIKDRDVYIFILKEAESFLGDLKKIRNTQVRLNPVELKSINIEPQYEFLKIQASSERLDAIVSSVFHLSRSQSTDLLRSESVHIGGIGVTNASRNLLKGDRVSVKGHGKFIYDGVSGLTRKGRLCIDVRLCK